MFWFFAICFAVVYIINMTLAFIQSKNYTNTYLSMRRRGRVAIGKRRGMVTTGAIVMFLLDADGTIVEGTRLTGVTVMSRFRPLPDFDGLQLTTLDATRDRRFTRSVRLATNNARDNYLFWITGQTPPEPPGPLSRIIDALRQRAGRPPKRPSVAHALAQASTVGTNTPSTVKQRIKLPQPR